MAYKSTSSWNEYTELMCLAAFKRLEADGFPRGQQMRRSRELADRFGLEPTAVNTQIGEYKSVAGARPSSTASENTAVIYERHGHLSPEEIEAVALGEASAP